MLINPEIVETRGKQVEEEGCLSLPEIREKVHARGVGEGEGAECARRVVRDGGRGVAGTGDAA